MPEDDVRTFGWQSDLPAFRDALPKVIQGSLVNFIPDASVQQIRAWSDSIPLLQREAGELLDSHDRARDYTAILEYKLPLESRRPDVVVLLRGPVAVIELKGREVPRKADIDQVSAYARDLRAYHRYCDGRAVHAVLVPTRMTGKHITQDDVYITSPAELDGLLKSFAGGKPDDVGAESFLDEGAYRPLPTLVQAARELLNSRSIRQLWRSGADTDNAVNLIAQITHEAAKTQTRHLVLLTGVPGAGKTLVGLRAVHSPFLDDLAVPRAGVKPTAPAIFLSGNGPLVEVLQYLLRGSGGGGRTFIRGVKDYLNTYSSGRRTPPEHLIVFDEAQRAFDASAVKSAHKDWPSELHHSEPQHFIRIAERIPEWSVVVGLIGEGQEIHVGEEGGIQLWREAVEGARHPNEWTVHAPPKLKPPFEGSVLGAKWTSILNLTTEMRFHLAKDLHQWVAHLLDSRAVEASTLSASLNSAGLRLYITRNLEVAKNYVQDRYHNHEDARFGLLASSKDKVLERFGVPNGFQDTKRVKRGPWYGGEGPESCRALSSVMTEFGAQGLELDFSVLCWGTDWRRSRNNWTNEDARKYRKKNSVKDPVQLRRNAYRVLLTRGRDGTIAYLPAVPELDETYSYLKSCGMRELES